jgi:hypothetical protein
MQFAMVHVTRLAPLIPCTNLTFTVPPPFHVSASTCMHAHARARARARTHAHTQSVNLWSHMKVCDVASVFYVLYTVHFIISLNQTNKCTRLLVSISKQILQGAHIKESQVLSASKHTMYSFTVKALHVTIQDGTAHKDKIKNHNTLCL